MAVSDNNEMPEALEMLSSERPRNVSWIQSAALLFGDWGTSRLYVLGLAFLVAGRSSFWLVGAMSVLILAVAWAYTQICRIYADGGGVYTAGRQKAPIVGVIGALLLFADYTVTASLSSIEAFHYFGLGSHDTTLVIDEDPGDQIVRQGAEVGGVGESLFKISSPGLWAIVGILAIGALNLLGPKHTAGFALVAAGGMVLITASIVIFALPQIDWKNLDLGSFSHPPQDLWYGFVYIVLALSGVEAIANLTGVMKKPVSRTAGRAIWFCAIEVAVLNLLLALAMVALAPAREAHKEDMLAYMAGVYMGPVGEWLVRIVGGLLLLSATNTAVGALSGTVYVMSRDGELPRIFQKLNGFGAPWIATVVATVVPVTVLLFVHDLKTLASMYAIGVVGAVAINTSLTSLHPRLRKWFRKTGMTLLAVLLVAIWLTLAFTKWHATAFVATVLTTGLALRYLTQLHAKRYPKPSLLRQAIIDQLPPGALARPRFLLATAGSARLAQDAIAIARDAAATLVVCFVRDVALLPKVAGNARLSLDTDPAAEELFVDFLELGHQAGVPIIPVYDSGKDSAELIAELAALNACQKVLIGSSRRGAIHKMIKGSFQRKLEDLLPPDILVEVLHTAGEPVVMTPVGE